MSTPNIRIAELDYDQILENLVAFMKADPAFADYDFAGSGLRLISRVLAYTTFYQNYYLSAAANEAFLDTAQLRSSVASHTRMLGYNMKGVESARITSNVAIQMESTSATAITLPAYTKFLHTAEETITFYNIDAAELTLDEDTGLYTLDGLELVEGRPLSHRWTVDLTNPTQRFVIPNANVDFTTISVTISGVPFSRTDNLLDIGPTDAVFFVQEGYDGFPELKFGNDVVGVAPVDADQIVATFLVSSGPDGNDVRGPFLISTPDLDGFVSGETAADADTVPSMGGTAGETLDNARFIAPLVYQAQNRCVTADDYKAVILEQMGSQVAAINVFGGEQGDPDDAENRPIFGRVFIALKPVIGLRFTDATRASIETNILKPRSIVGTVPRVIDPDYIYLNITTSVRYDPKATTKTRPALQAAIANNILTYAQNNVEKFDTSFRYSKFVRVVDDADESIVGSSSRIDLEKRVFPSLGESNQYVLKFNAALRRNSEDSAILEPTSHRFTYTNSAGVEEDECFFFEQDGVLSIAHRDSTGEIAIHESAVGTVDIDTGLVTIDRFAPDSIEDDEIDVRIRVIPAVNDFTPLLNQIFTIDADTGVQVQVLNDATATAAEQAAFFAGGVLP